MTTLQLQCQILNHVEVVKSLHVPPVGKKLEQLGMKNAKNKNKTKIQSKIKGTLGCCWCSTYVKLYKDHFSKC